MILATSNSATQAADAPSNKPTNHAGTIAIPDGLSMEGTQKAILKAAVGRRWEIKEKTVGKVVIQLVHRGYDSKLTFLYSKNEVKVFSDSWTIKSLELKKRKRIPKAGLKT